MNINTKHLRKVKTKHPLTESPSIRKHGQKISHSTPEFIVNSKQVI